MSDKYHLCRAEYDEETGVSTVTLETKWGTFTRSVTVRPDDADIANRWDGCNFAHYKCFIAMYKAKSRAFAERAKGIRTAKHAIAGNETWLTNEGAVLNIRDVNHRLERQAWAAEKVSSECRETAKEMEDKYLSYVESVLTARRKYREKY